MSEKTERISRANAKFNDMVIDKDIQERMKTLTRTELKYFKMIFPQSGVFYLQSMPGIGKSSIIRSIAKKMNWNFIDLRLAMSDETDFKWPYLTEETVDGVQYKVSDYAVPRWAFDANKRPTIIHFEELNRAPQFVRNASLQILLERAIGNFKFNDTVYMVASGNLGEEDGTDVEEFDKALNNRLIHWKHSLAFEDWKEDFADGMIHPVIVSYLEHYRDRLNQDASADAAAFATPRSWEFLSEYIIANYGYESQPKEWIMDVTDVGGGYIGASNPQFTSYCQNLIALTIQDIIKRFPQIKDTLNGFNRDKKSELMASLSKIDINTLKKKEVDNLIAFFHEVDQDERVAYFLELLDVPDPDNCDTENLVYILEVFRDDILSINESSEQINGTVPTH